MKITHRAPADTPDLPLALATEALVAAIQLDKAPRLSCCCRISELLPMLRQVHDAARTARLADEAQPGVAA